MPAPAATGLLVGKSITRSADRKSIFGPTCTDSGLLSVATNFGGVIVGCDQGGHVANIETSLKEAMTIEGAIGVALVDHTSGLTLGTICLLYTSPSPRDS